MLFSKKLKEMSASIIESCSRYEKSGSREPKLDDMQRRWIEVWGVSFDRGANA